MLGINSWWVGAERVLSEEERILGIGDSIREWPWAGKADQCGRKSQG